MKKHKLTKKIFINSKSILFFKLFGKDFNETSVESIGYPDISASSQFESGSFDLNSSQIKSS